MGKDIVETIHSFFHSSRLLRGINHTHVVLVPKVKGTMNMGQLRTINLCNVIYKIITKVMAIWLCVCLPHIILENQGAFVAGRLITDNVLLGQKGIHHLKSKRRGG